MAATKAKSATKRAIKKTAKKAVAKAATRSKAPVVSKVAKSTPSKATLLKPRLLKPRLHKPRVGAGLLEDVQTSEIGAFRCDIDIHYAAIGCLKVGFIYRKHIGGKGQAHLLGAVGGTKGG